MHIFPLDQLNAHPRTVPVLLALAVVGAVTVTRAACRFVSDHWAQGRRAARSIDRPGIQMQLIDGPAFPVTGLAQHVRALPHMGRYVLASAPAQRCDDPACPWCYGRPGQVPVDWRDSVHVVGTEGRVRPPFQASDASSATPARELQTWADDGGPEPAS